MGLPCSPSRGEPGGSVSLSLRQAQAFPTPPRSATMRESDLTATLDIRGLLEDAHGPGCYSVRLSVPEDFKAAWCERFDTAPALLYDRVAEASELRYVGASTDVYGRLCDHVASEVRVASIISVCPVAGVVDVKPCADPFEREYAYALEQADSETAVWVDGEIL